MGTYTLNNHTDVLDNTVFGGVVGYVVNSSQKADAGRLPFQDGSQSVIDAQGFITDDSSVDDMFPAKSL